LFPQDLFKVKWHVIPTTMGRRNPVRRALRWISISASGHASIALLFRNDVIKERFLL
jgi:hypothetical protein